MINKEEPELKGRVIFSDNYVKTFEELRSLNKVQPVSVSFLKSDLFEHLDGERVSLFGESNDPKNVSFDLLKKVKITNLVAYDESILELRALEGKLRCIAHCIVLQNEDKYVPAGYVTLKFFTESSLIEGNSTEYSDIVYSNDVSHDILTHYLAERKFIAEKAIPSNSLVFIDGSMFSGGSTAQNFVLVDYLNSINSPPVFFVKNSDSKIITNNFQFANGYNSDLHWAHTVLNEMQYTPFFRYESDDGRAKLMSFLKIYKDRSPIKIELPFKSYEAGLYPNDLFERIVYQFFANGSKSNVQPRIIQVAEIYAREILKSTNIYSEVEKMGLTKTMNEQREMFQ